MAVSARTEKLTFRISNIPLMSENQEVLLVELTRIERATS
jgi:hypothetical protein